MKKTHRIIVILFVCLAALYIIINQIDQRNLIGGNWTIINLSVIEYFPYLIGIGLGIMYIIKDKEYTDQASGRIFLLTSIVGILFAGLVYEMYIDNVWIDEIVTATFGITELQMVIVIIFIIFGFILGMSNN